MMQQMANDVVCDVKDLLRQFVEMGVFQDEEDVRKDTLMDYDVVLPSAE